MPDITMCTGENCSRRGSCYRHVATPTPGRQSYFQTTPVTTDGSCDYYEPAATEPDVELARWQDPATLEWWRLRRHAGSRCALESMSNKTMTRPGPPACWAHACMLTVAKNEYVDDGRARAEAEAYLAMGRSP